MTPFRPKRQDRPPRPWFRLACLVLLAALLPRAAANAEPLSDRDVQLMARIVGFLEPRPTGTRVVAIAHDPANPASRREAETIAASFGPGLRSGTLTLVPRIVEARSLGMGGFAAIIVAHGTDLGLVAAASGQLHVPSLAEDDASARSRQVTVVIRTGPKPGVAVNLNAAQSSGVTFAPAFLMMVDVF